VPDRRGVVSGRDMVRPDRGTAGEEKKGPGRKHYGRMAQRLEWRRGIEDLFGHFVHDITALLNASMPIRSMKRAVRSCFLPLAA